MLETKLKLINNGFGKYFKIAGTEANIYMQILWAAVKCPNKFNLAILLMEYFTHYSCWILL